MQLGGFDPSFLSFCVFICVYEQYAEKKGDAKFCPDIPGKATHPIILFMLK